MSSIAVGNWDRIAVYEAIGEVIADTRLTAAARLVYVALSRRLNFKNGDLFPSYDTICRDAGIARRSAVSAVKQLVDHGFIKLLCRGNSRASNRYSLNVSPRSASAASVSAPSVSENEKPAAPIGRARSANPGPAAVKTTGNLRELGNQNVASPTVPLVKTEPVSDVMSDNAEASDEKISGVMSIGESAAALVAPMPKTRITREEAKRSVAADITMKFDREMRNYLYANILDAVVHETAVQKEIERQGGGYLYIQALLVDENQNSYRIAAE